MAARILPFRSFVPDAAKPVMLSPVSGPLYSLYSQNSSKVLIMSNGVRRRSRYEVVEDQKTMLAKAEQELADGYLEVEITGLTFRRLAVAYAVLLRGAWSHTLDSVRSLLRPTPAL